MLQSFEGLSCIKRDLKQAGGQTTCDEIRLLLHQQDHFSVEGQYSALRTPGECSGI